MNKASIENEVIRRWQESTPMRRIAVELGITRHRVRKIILDHQDRRDGGVIHPDLPTLSASRGSMLDSHLSFVEQMLARWPAITATRIHEELRGQGFTGGYTIVKDLVRRLRPPRSREPVVRFETGPGVQAQMDYAVYNIDFTEEGRQRVNLFSYVLGYSRRQYLRFVSSQDFETTIREHVRAFEYLRGVATSCLYDNMKVVVARYEGDEPIYNTRFLAFATHYGYKVWACKRRRPRTKGKVERPFHYVETSLLGGREFRSLDHLNEVTAWWLAERADVRVHRETKRRPIDLHAEEQPYLIPLPDKPYDTAEVVYRAVNAEGMVAYRPAGTVVRRRPIALGAYDRHRFALGTPGGGVSNHGRYHPPAQARSEAACTERVGGPGAFHTPTHLRAGVRQCEDSRGSAPGRARVVERNHRLRPPAQDPGGVGDVVISGRAAEPGPARQTIVAGPFAWTCHSAGGTRRRGNLGGRHQ